MAKTCPKGKICFDSYKTILLIIFIIIAMAYIYYVWNTSKTTQTTDRTQITDITQTNQYQNQNQQQSFVIQDEVFHTRPQFEFTRQKDVLLNPYTPPLKHNFYFSDGGDPRFVPSIQHPSIPMYAGTVPVNIRTRSLGNVSYRQIGILTRDKGDETILPLFGRPVYTNRDKWNYYTTNDKLAQIKLPISKNKKSCTSEWGCDEILNGDTVYVEGYKDVFRATVYENDFPRYIPL